MTASSQTNEHLRLRLEDIPFETWLAMEKLAADAGMDPERLADYLNLETPIEEALRGERDLYPAEEIALPFDLFTMWLRGCSWEDMRRAYMASGVECALPIQEVTESRSKVFDSGKGKLASPRRATRVWDLLELPFRCILLHARPPERKLPGVPP